MPAAPSLADPVRPPDTSHPKHILYDRAYDPLSQAWFAALADAPEAAALLRDAPAHDLVTNLLRFNALFHALVDAAFDRMPDGGSDVVATASRYRDHILWVNHMAPPDGADATGIRIALGHKLKRNVSLGVIEALICLESAYTFGSAVLGLHGEELARVLQRSRQLYGSLALLHDDQEKVRLTHLTGISGYLMYPDVDFPDVIGRRVTIAADKFVVAGSADQLKIKFVSVPVRAVVLDSPIKRCPAHRFASPDHDGLTLNDVLWDLLIEIYRRSGRFG